MERGMDDRTTDCEKTWEQMRKTELNEETEALICSRTGPQIQVCKEKFDKTADSPLCRLCGGKVESITHIISNCERLAQREDKRHQG